MHKDNLRIYNKKAAQMQEKRSVKERKIPYLRGAAYYL